MGEETATSTIHKDKDERLSASERMATGAYDPRLKEVLAREMAMEEQFRVYARKILIDALDGRPFIEPPLVKQRYAGAFWSRIIQYLELNGDPDLRVILEQQCLRGKSIYELALQTKKSTSSENLAAFQEFVQKESDAQSKADLSPVLEKLAQANGNTDQFKSAIEKEKLHERVFRNQKGGYIQGIAEFYIYSEAARKFMDKYRHTPDAEPYDETEVIVTQFSSRTEMPMLSAIPYEDANKSKQTFLDPPITDAVPKSSPLSFKRPHESHASGISSPFLQKSNAFSLVIVTNPAIEAQASYRSFMTQRFKFNRRNTLRFFTIAVVIPAVTAYAMYETYQMYDWQRSSKEQKRQNS